MARIEELEIKGQIVALTTAKHKDFGTVIVVASNYKDDNEELRGLLTCIPHEHLQVFEF